MKPAHGLLLLAPLLLWGTLVYQWTYGFRAFTSFSAAAAAPGNLPRPAPSLRYVDHKGQRGELSGLAGRWTLVSFMYLRCPTVCHVALARMREVVRALEPVTKDRLVFLSLSFDDDTPAQLASMRAALQAPEAWSFAVLEAGGRLAGDPALERFGALVNRRPDGLYNHTTFFFLLDESQRLVKVISPERPDVVVREISESMR